MNAHRRQARLARRLLSRAEVLELSRRRPGVVYADLIIDYLWIACALILLATLSTWPAQVLAFVIIGTRQYALFIIGHDGLHRNLHANRRINDRISTWLIFAPLGMCLSDGRANHLRHHHQLGTTDDPDRYLHGAENKTDVLQFVMFLSGLSTFFKTVWKVTPFGQRHHQPDNGQTAALFKALIIGRLPVLIVQAAVFGIFAATMPWWYYGVFWVLPVFAGVFVPDEIRAFCDHAHPVVPDSAVDDHRLITYVPNALERLVFSPHHMNYHAEHHLWPFIPYHQLPEVHRRIRPRLGAHVEVRSSYVAFLWRYLCALPLLSSSKRQAARTGVNPNRTPDLLV